ncbi:MAG TPA: Nif11-like leader peptide family natural product precursor [Gammaproteobacteria bacterium]|nr:Nif11-like leader peptide family natural product precursor [Gammaproteobacteria bacterium]
MSKESLIGFVKLVVGDRELQAKIDDNTDADSLVAMGTEHGMDFSVDEVNSLLPSLADEELSDDDLQQIAGGARRISKSMMRQKIKTLVRNKRKELDLGATISGDTQAYSDHYSDGGP